MTAKKIIEKKKQGEKIVTITSYDYSFAKIVDNCGIDLILVGDSLSMVVLGYQNTLSVTMDEMIHHTKAVARGVSNSMVVGDMPFLSYKIGIKEAVKNAGRFIQEGGAEAVKVEGGAKICPTIKAMIDADIQVMGHIGLTPQAIYEFGGFLVQGKTVEAAKKLIFDAKKLEKTGLFGAMFRENAARALLLPKVSFNKRMPLWFNRLRSKKLLDAILDYKDFPILAETWRTCLKDNFDLPNLKKMLLEIEDTKIKFKEVFTDTPSPFANNLIWRQTNKYMYEDDTPVNPSVSGLKQDILKDLVFSQELRPQILLHIIDEFSDKIQRTRYVHRSGREY